MIFSVYDNAAKRFDYYEAPGNSSHYGARGQKYRALSQAPQGPSGLGGVSIGAVGFAPEALGMVLPENAVRVGSGVEARGIIASRARSSWSNVGGVDVGTGGLNGVGEVEPATNRHTFMHVVGAAVVASVVGVFVQRWLNDEKKGKKS